MSVRPTPIWVSDERCALGENPLWDPESQSLWWINIADEPAVFRWRSGTVTRFPCPRPVGSLYLTTTARMLVALRTGLAWLDIKSGALLPVDTPGALSADDRFNDGRCDRRGNLWISTLERTISRAIGSIVHFDSKLAPSRTPSHAIIGNGICFSPDDRWLYFSDSRGRAIRRFGKREDNTLGEAETLVELDAAPGRPDGCTVDEEGCLWSARIGGGRIDRYTPGGQLVSSLLLPVAHPTHCTFGRVDLKTLYVTTAMMQATSEVPDDLSLAGAVLAFDVGVAGTPEQRFSFNDGVST